jgi:hypothetical protein
VRKASALAIGLLTTLAICYQDQTFFAGFTWASIHGVGPSRYLALAPAAVVVAIVWLGYAALKRRTLTFAVYAAGIVMLNEIVVPVTPLKTLRHRQVIERVEVRDIRDELFVADDGQPIGIGLKFDAIFPETGAYLVGPSTLMPIDTEVPFDLQFGHTLVPAIVPPPSRDAENQVFQKGIVYTFRIALLPNFVLYDDVRTASCLEFEPRPSFSEADLLTALARNRHTRYRGEIHVSATDYPGGHVVATEYVTTRAYDLEAMYRTVGVVEKRCRRGASSSR